MMDLPTLGWLLERKASDLRRIASHAARYYHPFDIRRSGSDWRHIDNPVEELREIQRRLYRRVFRDLEFGPHVMGFVPGRSIAQNARPHLRKPVVVTLDIRKCFPSIRPEQVYNVFTGTLGFPPDTAAILTKLTTFQYRLPQGAPTSPTLANLVLAPVYAGTVTVAEALGLECSFWADDIALSGPDAQLAIQPTIDVIHRHGFRVNRRKIEVMPAASEQRVTGNTVNATLSVGRDRLTGIRHEIYRLCHSETVREQELESVLGKIGQVRSVNPAQGEALERYARSRLPPSGTAERERRNETRRCSHTRRHTR
jgi:RNA-directed DNA polymerase